MGQSRALWNTQWAQQLTTQLYRKNITNCVTVQRWFGQDYKVYVYWMLWMQDQPRVRPILITTPFSITNNIVLVSFLCQSASFSHGQGTQVIDEYTYGLIRNCQKNGLFTQQTQSMKRLLRTRATKLAPTDTITNIHTLVQPILDASMSRLGHIDFNMFGTIISKNRTQAAERILPSVQYVYIRIYFIYNHLAIILQCLQILKFWTIMQQLLDVQSILFRKHGVYFFVPILNIR